jgi:hypothetical protein
MGVWGAQPPRNNVSDQRLRQLQRRWAETGDPADAARFLLERVRTGELSLERLRLAAYLGDPPAVAALEGEAPRSPGDLESFVRNLAGWDQAALVRAAIAAARLVLPGWDATWADERPLQAVRAAERWVEEPSQANTDRAEAEAEAAMAAFAELLLDEALVGEPSEAVVRRATGFRESRAAVQAALAAARPARAATFAVMAAVAARERLALDETPATSRLYVRAADAERLGDLPELTSPRAVAAVRRAIVEALLPWALA